MTTETDMLETNIKNLERENRELRITLRDQFAMAALTGLISENGFTAYSFAVDAYEMADHMIKARQ